MKVKVKLDAKTIQELLLQNVEKIGLGIVALIFLLMVYSALNKVERYPKTPEQLHQLVREKEELIRQTPPATDLTVQDYPARIKGIRAPVNETNYATTMPWTNPLFPTRPRRPAPPLLAAQGLRGKADVGPFQMIADPAEIAAAGDAGNAMMPQAQMATNEVRGQRWIVLTALVPVEKQALAYFEAFRPCKGYEPQRDYPNYLVYWIERVEASNPAEAANVDWTKAKKIQSNEAIKEAKSKWAQAGAEVVESKYLHARLVFPAGPLVERQWDESVAHAPEIPLPTVEGGGVGPMGAVGRGAFPSDDMLGGGGMRRPNPYGGGMYPHGGVPGAGGVPGREDDIFSTEKKDPLENDPARAEQIAEQNKPPAHLLLRFFDFDVQPGKYYVYRVRLGIDNPNYKLKPADLADPKLAEPRWLETKWSDPSTAIFVPRDTRVLAVSVSPGRAGHDPIGKVMMTKWVHRRGFLAHEEISPVERGQMLNYPDRKFSRVQGGSQPYGAGAMGAMGVPMPPEAGLEGIAPGRADRARPGADRRAEGRPDTDRRAEAPDRRDRGRARIPDNYPPDMYPGVPGRPGGFAAPAAPGDEWLVNFYSNAIAIDLRGGEKLPGRGSDLTTVGEILLLDADGNLVVRNALDDQAERDKITAAYAPPTAPSPGFPGDGIPPTAPKARGELDKLFRPGGPAKKTGHR